MSKVMLGYMSFVASSIPHNECGTNGLPLTPNSVKVLGRAQVLTTLKHENLCRYVDFKIEKHGRIFCVSECYKESLYNRIKNPMECSISDWNKQCLKISQGVLKGIDYLNSKKMVHQNMDLSNIYLDAKNEPKLFGFGLHHMTDGGKLIDSPIGSIKYLSPEQIFKTYCNDINDMQWISTKSDVWAFSLILFELIHKEIIWEDRPNKEIISNILELCLLHNSDEVILKLRSYLPEDNDKVKFNSGTALKLEKILKSGLNTDQVQRKTPTQILNECFDSEDKKAESNGVKFDIEGTEDSLIECFNSEEIWYLWNLAGGDILSTKSTETTPSIFKLPKYVTHTGDILGLPASPENLFNPEVTTLPLDTIEKKLVEINSRNPSHIYPLLETDSQCDIDIPRHESSTLPTLIKQYDFDYQANRIALFKRLLIGFPYLRENLWSESKIDIPPFYRGRVWACLLDVKGNFAELYLNLDKETPTVTDRQIAVDIPRCHQYNRILSSPTAHKKLRRVLKAWLAHRPNLTYWQGLDSLCAVLVHLNFNNEPLAFACMTAFIDKYLHNFFLKDNSAVIREYLLVFSHLLSFHDPVLSSHMNEVGFIPDLYAIPWFLTMFAHVFPLHKIVHLWDTLIMGNSSFPLCIGIGILHQLRSQLLECDFNECILLFSDLPEIDIDAVVQKSINIFCQTPKSSTFRVHDRHWPHEQSKTSDYSAPSNELSIQPMTVEELKQEVCCSISAGDLIQLCELQSLQTSKALAKNSKPSKAKIFIIDTRTADEFSRGAVPESFNYIGPKTFPLLIQTIQQKLPKVVVLIGNHATRQEKEVASQLIGCGTKGVCVLQGGIEVLKPTGVLTIPS